VEGLKKAVETHKPDRIFHLGDGLVDALRLQEWFPDIPLDFVRGERDMGAKFYNYTIRMMLEGKKIYLCHGHRQAVEDPRLSVLRFQVRTEEIDLCCFGHTRISRQEREGKGLLLNPGQMERHPSPSYALVNIQDGKIRAEIIQAK
jgi:putative phosphoesterase